MNRRVALLLAGSLALASVAAVTVTMAANASSGCRVAYSVPNQWNSGLQAEVAVTNTGERLSGWTLAFDFPDAGQKVTQSWNADVTQKGRTATFRNARWNGSVAANGTVSFGFLATSTGGNAVPTRFSLNGVSCGAKATPSTGGTSPSATSSPVPSASSSPKASPMPTTSRAPVPSPTAKTPGKVAGYFSTLPPGSALPSSAQCADAVRATPIAENKGANAAANRTAGHPIAGASGLQKRVDGNFTGTTAQILRWAACKWGVDEDLVKAQAAIESWWRMDTKGDFGTDATRCPPGHAPGADGKPGSCPESFGLLQVRYPFNQSAFPMAATSSAFNADYAYSSWRACFEGEFTWLNTVERGSQYRAGDATGCMGVWFSGRWHTAAGDGYVTRVKGYLAQRIWETRNFQEP